MCCDGLLICQNYSFDKFAVNFGHASTVHVQYNRGKARSLVKHKMPVCSILFEGLSVISSCNAATLEYILCVIHLHTLGNLVES